MSLKSLTATYPWARYSRRLKERIQNPRNSGSFSKEDAENRQMRLAKSTEGSLEEGNAVTLYWLVDPTDGIIVDARYQVFGQSALIGAAEASCEAVVGKNYDQAKRLSADLVDRALRDRESQDAFPWETSPHLNLVMSAIDEAAESVSDLPLPKSYAPPPSPFGMDQVIAGEGYPGYIELSSEEKLALIEQVLDQDLRPFIALDAGGVEVVSLDGNTDLTIQYQGACTSCMSSVGATLSYIQQTLRAKVHPELKVIPKDSLI